MIVDPKLEAAHRDLTARVMGRSGITGTAIGEEGGKPCLKVYLSDERAAKNLPESVGGYRVVAEIAGPFRPL